MHCNQKSLLTNTHRLTSTLEVFLRLTTHYDVCSEMKSGQGKVQYLAADIVEENIKISDRIKLVVG
jgi:hypothetical protein